MVMRARLCRDVEVGSKNVAVQGVEASLRDVVILTTVIKRGWIGVSFD